MAERIMVHRRWVCRLPVCSCEDSWLHSNSYLRRSFYTKRFFWHYWWSFQRVMDLFGWYLVSFFSFYWGRLRILLSVGCQYVRIAKVWETQFICPIVFNLYLSISLAFLEHECWRFFVTLVKQCIKIGHWGSKTLLRSIAVEWHLMARRS